jgi:hypothetical protein
MTKWRAVAHLGRSRGWMDRVSQRNLHTIQKLLSAVPAGLDSRLTANDIPRSLLNHQPAAPGRFQW